MSSKAASSEGAEVPRAMHASPSTELIDDSGIIVQSSPAAMAYTPPVLSAASSTASLASRVPIAEYKGGGDDAASGGAAGAGGAGDSPQRAHPASTGTIGRRTLAGQTRDELRAAFSVFDTDGSGSITVSEFSVVFKMLGYASVSDSELTELITTLDQNEDGTITFEEFVNVMTARRSRGGAGGAGGGAGAAGSGSDGGSLGGIDPVDDALSVFDTSDPKITRMDSAELWHICGLLKENLSEEERECILKEMHADAEGNINFAKIVQQMMPGNS